MSDGLIAFLLILGLALAAVLLFRSMAHHLRKVPPSFDKDDDQPPKRGPDAPA